MKLKPELLLQPNPPRGIHADQSLETMSAILSAFHYDTPLMICSPHEPIEKDATKPGLTFKTSGSSGTPKRVHLTKENLYYSALGVNEYLNVTHASSWQLSLPLFHVAGVAILIRMLIAKGTLHLDEPADFVSLVPTQLARERPTSTTVVVGGAKIPEHLLAPNVIVSYGMTEMASTVTLDGHLLSHRTLQLDTSGRIHVGGKTLSPDCAPLLATQDKGHFDSQGRLHIDGRFDRLIIKGGENIDPTEIEQELLKTVDRAIVIPFPDIEYGQVPIAFIDPFIATPPLNLPKFKHPLQYYPIPKHLGFKPTQEELLAAARVQLPLV